MRAQTKAIAVAFVAVCLAIDLLPHSGHPEFRYTGSDPTTIVWNLGWPLALALYDPRSGLHIGPFAYLVPPAQLLILVVAKVLVVVVRWAVVWPRFSRRGRLYPGRDA